jgi:hypothetical protein
MYATFWSENLKGRDHSADLNVEGTIILEWLLEKVVDWINLALDRDKWQTLSQ